MERELIQRALAKSQQVVKRGVDDVSDAEARRLPAPTLSPIIWQVGHLANSNRAFMERAGVKALELPQNFPALFKGGSGGEAAYPPLAEVVKIFDETHDALLRTVAEATLETPIEGPRGMFNTLGEMFLFADAHRWYHIGKITSLRALLGKPRLFG